MVRQHTACKTQSEETSMQNSFLVANFNFMSHMRMCLHVFTIKMEVAQSFGPGSESRDMTLKSSKSSAYQGGNSLMLEKSTMLTGSEDRWNL